MATADDLRAAKALIDTPEKWIKGEFSRNGCYCAAGAIAAAVGHNPRAAWARGSRWREAKDALELALEGDLLLPEYNDAPDTTHADVMSLFDRAIAAETGRAKQ